MCMEKWKTIQIEPYEGFYEVSNYGRVRSLERWIKYANGKGRLQKERMLKQAKFNNFGHLLVGLSYDGKTKTFSVHRLVAQAFIPNPKGYPYVLHNDDNPRNNKVDNLRFLVSRVRSSVMITISSNSTLAAVCKGYAEVLLIFAIILFWFFFRVLLLSDFSSL